MYESRTSCDSGKCSSKLSEFANCVSDCQARVYTWRVLSFIIPLTKLVTAEPRCVDPIAAESPKAGAPRRGVEPEINQYVLSTVHLLLR